MTGVRAVDTQLIVVKDQAFTPDEYVRYRRAYERELAYRRRRYATDPEYRERVLAYQQEWRAAHPELVAEYRRRQNERRRAQYAARRAA